MQQSDDQPPLQGVARSLDDLFTRVQGPAAPAPSHSHTEPAPRRPPPLLTDGPDPVDLVEGPLLDRDVLVEEIAGPIEHQPAVDPREEKRARLQASSDSLTQAVDSFVAGEGDLEGLAQLIRDDAVALREENLLTPLLDAVERLARSAPVQEPDHRASGLARQLANPTVAAGIALRLASAREDERRAELTAACKSLGEEAAVAIAAALASAGDRSERRNLLDGLVAMGDQGLAQAELMVKDGNSWGVVRNGVTILGELGGEKAVAYLMDTLQHHNPKVRRETLTALTRIGGDGATLLVMGKLDDPDDDVRATAVRAAGMLGSDREVRTLLARLDEEQSEEVIQEILRALGQMGDPGAVTAIEKRAVGSFFSRPSTEIRIAAYRALSLIGTPKAKGVIEAATEDKDPEVRAAARSLSGRA